MNTLALYVHWPFCLSKCPYCDFNSHVRARIDHARFGAALAQELAWEAARLGRRQLGSIFFGGGTPSLMTPDLVADLIAQARALFDAVPDLEITLEANPTSVEAGKLAGFAQAGVNRLSMGLQALDDAALQALGRTHSAAEARAAFALARRNFVRLSFDLIYARPGQSLASWEAELREALGFAADHLSLYQLTIEPGTAYEGRARRGEITLPEPELAQAMYELTETLAGRAGLLAYEVSNFARPGAESRHNLAYWRYQDYAGIGPGAHGRLTLPDGRVATRRHRAPEPWAQRVERLGHGTQEETTLSAQDCAREALLMGLRLSEGVAAAGFAARTGMALADAIDAGFAAMAEAEGLLRYSPERIAATAQGRALLDALLPRLLR